MAYRIYSSDVLKEKRIRVDNVIANKSPKDENVEVFLPNRKNKNTKYTIFHSYDKVKVFTDDEIKEENEKMFARNQAGVNKALADGYVELPIFLDDINGKPRELKAWVPKEYEPSFSKGFFERHQMDYNIYVPSYNRAEDCSTVEMLKRFHIDNWYLMIDPEEYEKYKQYYPTSHIILRDVRFRDRDMVNLTTSIKRPISMSGTAGVYNNILSFSRSIGERKFFTMDDDFVGMALKTYKGPGLWKTEMGYRKEDFYRCSDIKEKYDFSFKEYLHLIEDYANKLRNHGFVGLEKFGLVFALPPQWKRGTRVYSFYLTDCNSQNNHVGAMNNDVITSIEQSKHGFPPCLLEIIGYNSKPTQSGGGLTDQYKLLGTLEKGKILVKNEPSVARINYNYNRVHHFVNYNSYTGQRLVGNFTDTDKNE